MRRHIIRALYAAAAAGIALTTFGFAGASAPATAAAPSLSPPIYNTGRAGYHAEGRWFRFVATTVTIPSPVVPKSDSGDFWLGLSYSKHGASVNAVIIVEPGGGPGSVSYEALGHGGTFAISPKAGDQLAVSIYYDKRHPSTYLTANDLTQGITKTVRVTSGSLILNSVNIVGIVLNTPPPPPADVRLWKVASTHLTTYPGVHGTVTGPWQTSQMIATTDGTATGAVVLSPSGLWNGGQNFGIWLRHR